MTEIDEALRHRQRISGDALPPEAPKRSPMRRHAARFALAVALRLDASAAQR